MNLYALEQLVAVARSGSSFYGSLYRDVPAQGFALTDLPLARFEAVMEAVHENFEALIASRDAYGMFYTTSGTTGRPKATLFGRDEWRATNQLLATLHWRSGLLRDGDVICNLSEPGSASFLAIHGVAQSFPGRCSELPIGCDRPFAEVERFSRQFRSNVLAGMNPTLFGYAMHLLDAGKTDESVERVLGGGELFLGAQREAVRAAFPKAVLCPFFYGAAEAGMIGYSCADWPEDVYRPLDGACCVEIVDDSGQPIDEPGRIGTVLVTNFLRLAAPVIRFGTGDLAHWVDAPGSVGRRFSLHGRRFPYQASIGGQGIGAESVHRLLGVLSTQLKIIALQLVLTGSLERPLLTLELALFRQSLPEAELEERVLHAFASACPELWRELEPSRISVCERPFAHFSGRTRRKTQLVLDRRELP
jgi:phenylacetate-CoA ligase